MKAIRVHQVGGPETLVYEDVPLPEPGPGQALVKIEAAGVNYIDTYHRSGAYPQATPFGLGSEGAGTVTAVGAGVHTFQPGDRVVYAQVMGSYAEYVCAPVDKLVPVPAAVSTRVAAAVLLQGMTAHYLVYDTYKLQAGETALVHAAAGGAGLLLVQLASKIGARVIGTVSTAAKEALARAAGAHEVIRYTEQDFEAEVKRLTAGDGVAVVYDSVGQTTFEKSLNVLKRRGMLVLFGQSSGAVPSFNPQILNAKGSLYLTRPSLFHYVATREELLARAAAVLELVERGALTVRIDHEFPLSAAADAHRAIESRATTGKVLLIP
jgi:NADPH:quinone reductase